MTPSAREKAERFLGTAINTAGPLGGGCVGDVQLARLSDGRDVVIKSADATLDCEARMLARLADAGLPVPGVLYTDPTLLIMTALANDGRIDAACEKHAAELIAGLHANTADAFGFDEDTVIGGLHQPNPRMSDWKTFFGEQRLLFMAGEAYRAGRLDSKTRGRIERLAGRLGEWIDDDVTPSLIHGDLWGGNVLCANGRVTGFIDPAVYYADAEIELAFTTLFATFGDAFFTRYQKYRPIKAGFFERRRNLYNLYPLLVHVRLFGGHYVGQVQRTLEDFGC